MARLAHLLVLFGAAASTLAQSTAVDNLVRQLPACALACIAETGTADGCALDDYKCLCQPSKTDPSGQKTAVCLYSSCSSTDTILTSSIASQICVQVALDSGTVGVGAPTSYYGYGGFGSPTATVTVAGSGSTPTSGVGSGSQSSSQQGGGGGGNQGLSTGAIVGIAVGVVGIVLILAAILGVFLWRRRAARLAQQQQTQLPPPAVQPGGQPGAQPAMAQFVVPGAGQTTVQYNPTPELGGQALAVPPPADMKAYVANLAVAPSPQPTTPGTTVSPISSGVSPQIPTAQTTPAPPYSTPSPPPVSGHPPPHSMQNLGYELSSEPPRHGPAELGGYHVMPPELGAGTPAPYMPPELAAQTPRPPLPPELAAMTPQPQMPPELAGVQPAARVELGGQSMAPPPQGYGQPWAGPAYQGHPGQQYGPPQ